VTAEGHITMWRFGDRYKGDALQLNLETGKGWVLHPEYRLAVNNAQGKAQRIDFLGEDQAVVSDGTYSTCEGPDPDWYLKSSRLRLDQGRDVGTAGKTIIYFKDVPIIGTPALSFSLSGARRSGWLPPTIGVGSKGSAELMVPYYFNIAPNRDLTVFPRYIFTRGLQLGATGRYLGETDAGRYNGETHVEFLANDPLAHRDRLVVGACSAAQNNARTQRHRLRGLAPQCQRLELRSFRRAQFQLRLGSSAHRSLAVCTRYTTDSKATNWFNELLTHDTSS